MLTRLHLQASAFSVYDPRRPSNLGLLFVYSLLGGLEREEKKNLQRKESKIKSKC